MKSYLLRCVVVSSTIILVQSFSAAQGKVYFVLGSDTAIWDGMDVGKYTCHYRLDLYTAPQDNAYKVMDPSFRARLVDSYGQSVKLTWWMMAGNIFRYADNLNVPVPNIMTLHLMNQYHGAAIRQFGDELTLHYHTFSWTDYNGDGKFYWNQAHSFAECRDDFDYTLAQFLLEEGTFPVSFRSGWHYMDNGWQIYLNTLLPFSLHDDFPNVRASTAEPIDNVYDWSHSSAEFVPFHPSVTDYQIPGNGKGWNVRSIHMGNVGQSLMNQIFAQAAGGKDLVVCPWAHLPEVDFLANIQKIDSLAHTAASLYPGVQFRYCTAVEAMQRWLQTFDHTAPQVTVQEVTRGDSLFYEISTDEPIFQSYPFVAVKNVYEDYRVVPCQNISGNLWHTLQGVPRATLARVGVAVTDTVGNLTTRILRYLPDDVFIDNLDGQYSELSGTWSATTISSWGTDARVALLGATDTAKVRWALLVAQTGRYNLFAQVPPVINAASRVSFRTTAGNQTTDSVYFSGPLTSGEWVFLSSLTLSANTQNYLEMIVPGNGQPGRFAVTDVIRLTPLVRDREILSATTRIDFGTVSQEDTASASIQIMNRGVSALTLLGIDSRSADVSCRRTFPVSVSPMKSVILPFNYVGSTLGKYGDTLAVLSDDPVRPRLALPWNCVVAPYFTVADNEDSSAYVEYGEWHYSNAQANGISSRYSPVSAVGSYALFTSTLRMGGTYDVLEIVPKTQNATTSALYVLSAGGHVVDSVFLDQNKGSGGWVRIGTYPFAVGTTVSVKVTNAGPTTSGLVLRADAIKFASASATSVDDRSTSDALPQRFELAQNFPNPFNPATMISYALPERSDVRLEIFNAVGQKVALLVQGVRDAGWYRVHWNASYPSGMYFCRIEAISSLHAGLRFVAVKKMVLLK